MSIRSTMVFYCINQLYWFKAKLDEKDVYPLYNITMCTFFNISMNTSYFYYFQVWGSQALTFC